MTDLDTAIECWVHAARVKGNPDRFEIGEDVSHHPALKIVFEGYAEEDSAADPLTCEHYAIYIHRHAGEPGFVFPPHERGDVFSFNHRADSEVRHPVWYCLEQNLWCSPPLALSVEQSGLELGEVRQIVSRINQALV